MGRDEMDGRTGPAVDPAAIDALMQMTGDDPVFLRELVEVYLDDAPLQLEQMRAAMVTGDAEQLRRAAHTLKSNSANMGAGLLSEQCRQIEALARNGQLDVAAPTVAAAATEFHERVRAELQALAPAVPET